MTSNLVSYMLAIALILRFKELVFAKTTAFGSYLFENSVLKVMKEMFLLDLLTIFSWSFINIYFGLKK